MATAYIRNREGNTYELPVEKALQEFFGDRGYRITLEVDGHEITLWNSWDRDAVRDEKYVECLATIISRIDM